MASNTGERFIGSSTDAVNSPLVAVLERPVPEYLQKDLSASSRSL